MTWSPNISTERREAIGRAGRAVVRLATDREAKGARARRLPSDLRER